MAPELAPFMADECLLSMPEVEGIDYTMKEYIKLVEKTKECVERLNAQGEYWVVQCYWDNQLTVCPPGGDWTPHKVELTVWSFFVLRENKPHVLDDLPSADSEPKRAARENGLRQEVSNGQGEEGEEGEEPQPETWTDHQQREAEAESPAEQTDRSYVEPQVRCFTFFIFIFIPPSPSSSLSSLNWSSLWFIKKQPFWRNLDIGFLMSFSWMDPILEIFSESNQILFLHCRGKLW